MYAEYSSLIDTALVTALAVIVWAAYREVRRRQAENRTSDHHLSGSAS